MHYFEAAVAMTTAAAASFFDVRTGRIPDTLTLIALGFGLGASCAFGPLTFLTTLGAVGVVVVTATFVEHQSFRFGGGDYKLMAAIGAILGFVGLLLAALGVAALLQILPPKISRPMAPLILGGVVFSVAMKEVLGC
jgi:prepilin signal peptidase PulO-like enzyme (type II secretory pathway)